MKNVYFVCVPDVMFEFGDGEWAYEYAGYIAADTRTTARLAFVHEYDLDFTARLSIRKLLHNVETEQLTGDWLVPDSDLFKQADNRRKQLND